MIQRFFHDLFEHRVVSAVSVAKPAVLIVHAQVVAMVRTEGNEVSLQMFHMELGVLTVVVAVVKVGGSVKIADRGNDRRENESLQHRHAGA